MIHTEKLYNKRWFACLEKDKDKLGTIDRGPYAIADSEQAAIQKLKRRIKTWKEQP